MPHEIEYIPVAEAAARTGKSKWAIVRACTNGTLGFKRFGKRTYMIDAGTLANVDTMKRGRPKGTTKDPVERLVAKLRRLGKPKLASEIEKVLREDAEQKQALKEEKD